MYRLKCKACGDYLEVEMPMQKLHQWNPKFEGVKKIDNYFAPENGRCEKLPNPRYGREKYRLHIRKLKVYYVNVADTVACHSKCFFRISQSFLFLQNIHIPEFFRVAHNHYEQTRSNK